MCIHTFLRLWFLSLNVTGFIHVAYLSAVLPSPAVHCLISESLVRQKTPVAVSLTGAHCVGGVGVFLHPVVGSGTDRLPHLPDLPQPDHQ